MKIGIIGLGLIGGSIAKECRNLGHKVFGADLNPIHCEQAVDLEIVDRILDLEGLMSESEVIGLCIPVDKIAELLPKLLDQVKWSQVLFDVGSTKKGICDAVRSHPKRGLFVPAHPLAGTEYSGPRAAILDLFRHKKNIVCEEERCDEQALSKVIQLFDSIGMQTLFMNPDDHDKHMAYVSHLSHISAFTLSLTVLDIEEDEKQIFNLASTGFESTVRLAKSNPQTWSSIFEINNVHLSKALENYIEHLQTFKSIIDSKDRDQSIELLERANEIRRVLNGLKLNVVKLS
jgi:prephenate dehydrogenase